MAGAGFWNAIPTGGEIRVTSDLYGVLVTRLSNYNVANEEPFPFDEEFVDNGGWWNPATPTVLTVPRTGWYWVGAKITTLGTGYTGPDNSWVLMAVLRNWDGVSAQLDAYVAFDRVTNFAGDGAQGNSLPPSLVHLTAGDELQLVMRGPTASGLLVESNQTDGQPGCYGTDTGPGTLSPHFFAVSAQNEVTVTGSTASSELLVMDGSSPPETLTLEDGSDYLYKDG